MTPRRGSCGGASARTMDERSPSKPRPRRADKLDPSAAMPPCVAATGPCCRSPNVPSPSKAIDEVPGLFGEYMRVLYGVAGRLSVDIGREGYTFSFTFERQGSDGVEQMVVFCFDLTVASFWAKRKQGFPVLAHDSTLFADVDPRQYAGSLKLAASESEKHGFQYICCLNTGSLPQEGLLEYNLQAQVRGLLTDEGPEGRLLGVILPPRDRTSRRKR
jgi:uncharacterized protein YydD (DUF2326 family)